MIDLSVIVPTHNRQGFLPGLLASLAKQDYPAERWELVIIDDGSSDGTPEYLASYGGEKPRNIEVISQPQSGVATARNNAVRAAHGRAVLFLDDDMTASPSLVREHACVHLEDPAAVVIGHVHVPADNREPWIAWEDIQLARHFDALNSGRRIPGPRDFYSGNCSVSTSLFNEVNGYDTTLPRTEDVELGYRLKAAGAHFYYRAEADSLHLGRHTFDGWLRNARLYGRADVILAWHKGHEELRWEIFRWFYLRKLPNRVVVRACASWPILQKPTIRALNFVGTITYKRGARRLSKAGYSAIYNLAYWLGVIDEIGARRFWAGVNRAKRMPAPVATKTIEAELQAPLPSQSQYVTKES